MIRAQPGPGLRSTTLIGILLAITGSAIFSINDLAIKALSTGYALHQVILTRSLISLIFVLGFMSLTGTRLRQLRTTRLRGHLLRVGFVMLSNIAYFLGLAALPPCRWPMPWPSPLSARWSSRCSPRWCWANRSARAAGRRWGWACWG